MKAVVYTDYGPPDVLEVRDIKKPIPNDDQVLVRTRAAALNPLDWHFMEGTPYLGRLMGMGLRKPKSPRLGVDLAGGVEAVGKNVTQFKPGDEVFGTGHGAAFAEYVCANKTKLVLKPASLTFEQAAAVPVAGLTALQGLRDKGHVHAGQKVLINGASGGVGTFAVQIAKVFGADVTGVCSTRNVDLVRSLGADRVIDYTKEDFTNSNERYDVILDNVGTQPISGFRRVLAPKGIYVLIGGGGTATQGLIGPLARPIKLLFMSPFINQKMGMMFAEIRQDDLAKMGEWIESGKVKPVIDRSYPLDQIADAMRYLEQGHARGKVILAIEQENKT
ncbi:MAG TPA: NAD(P)-dependent alcohol dehydrogenase [Chthoniobacterales bacterium]|nr:NAD(P)-dependent alcohol dehydrogenase [Chthoniobacterales bacterium]